MRKVFLFIILILLQSCTFILKNLGSTSSQTILGVLVGFKPPDSDFILSEEPSFIEEGSSQTIKIHLGKRPDTDTTVTISSDNSSFVVNDSSSTSLVFTPNNYSTNQSFTVASLIDNNQEDETDNIIISADYGYATKSWQVTNSDIQGSNSWITIFPEEVFLPFLVSKVNIRAKLKIKPSENVSITFVPTFLKNPYSDTGYENKGMTLNSSLTFTPENFSVGQVAMIIDYSSLFNTDIINNQNSFRLLAYSTTFSSKSDIQIFKNSINSRSRVETIAGAKGNSGSINGNGTSAQFDFHLGVVIDSTGTNLYISDSYNHTIRKMVVSTGEVTTIAGLAGETGSTDGTGTTARFNLPCGITTDGTNLFITDSNNHTIRKIEISSNIVSTIAGTAGSSGTIDGIGTSAKLKNPFRITTDATNLYVTDTYNHTIRKIEISSGKVTTISGIAGTPGSIDDTSSVATFNNPVGITSDGSNLYISEIGNHTIRKISELLF
ncbi:MAG: hypothetical protein KDK36_09440 [Leptospiraceae bacterium]|nr:hypothetical protein [Leptospiraceae bacterium]